MIAELHQANEVVDGKFEGLTYQILFHDRIDRINVQFPDHPQYNFGMAGPAMKTNHKHQIIQMVETYAQYI